MRIWPQYPPRSAVPRASALSYWRVWKSSGSFMAVGGNVVIGRYGECRGHRWVWCCGETTAERRLTIGRIANLINCSNAAPKHRFGALVFAKTYVSRIPPDAVPEVDEADYGLNTGVSVSAGSACSSGKVAESTSLKPWASMVCYRCAIRIGLGFENTVEVDKFIEVWSGLKTGQIVNHAADIRISRRHRANRKGAVGDGVWKYPPMISISKGPARVTWRVRPAM